MRENPAKAGLLRAKSSTKSLSCFNDRAAVGQTSIHSLPGPLQGYGEGIVERDGKPCVVPPPDEGQAQRFALSLRYADAVAAANALARFEDDRSVIRAGLERTPRRGIAVATGPQFPGGIAEPAVVGLAAVAAATAAGLANGLVGSQAPALACQNAGALSAITMNCGISSGLRHLTWLENGWIWGTNVLPRRN